MNITNDDFNTQPQSDEYATEHEEMRGTFAAEPADDGDCWDGDDVSEYADECEEREDNFRDDVEADADTLASAGYGTDEDYGYYGEESL